MYYDPDMGLLRFQDEGGEPLSEATDIDLVSKAHHYGIRPLLLLAHAEGLVDKVPSGRLTTLDFQTNLDSGYYIRANIQKTGVYQPAISLPEASRSFRFRFMLSGPPKQYVRFFPYVHEDQSLHFWDVERSKDLDVRWGLESRSWRPQEVQKRIPELFKFARSLGYWGSRDTGASSRPILTAIKALNPHQSASPLPLPAIPHDSQFYPASMFFSTELLLKRESGLGLLWLAATIGSKASFKKLNKKSILSADISKLCDMIAEPEEPLALRLSSNLLVGVARCVQSDELQILFAQAMVEQFRVHRAQHEMFYNDVMTCFTTLKRAFVEITAAENQLQGPLTLSKDQLALRDTCFDIDLDVLDAVWIEPIIRQPTPSLSQDEPQVRATINRPPSYQSQGTQSADERRRLNLLPEKVPDFSGPSDDPFVDPDEQFFEGDQVDLGLDLGLDFGDAMDGNAYDMGEGGYHDELQPLNDEQEQDVSAARHASTVATPIKARRDRTASSAGQRKTPSSDLVFGDPALPDISSSGDVGQSQFLELAFADEMPPEPPVRAPQPQTKTKKRKQQNVEMLLWDEKIELSEQELLQNREGYEERMKKERREMLLKQRRFETANLVQSMIQGPLLGAIDPGMVSWYKDILKTQHSAFSAQGRAQIDDGFAVPALPKKRRKTTKKDKNDGVEEGLGFAADLGALNGFPSDDTNGGNMPFDDNMDWMQDVRDDGGVPQLGSAEPEQGRRGSSLPSSDLGSHLNKKPQPASQRTSNAPWEIDAVAPEAAPADYTVNTPGRMRRSRSLSIVRVGQEDENAMEVGDSFTFEEEIRPEDAGGTAEDSQMTDMSLITMQRTMEIGSARFLTYLVANVDQASKSVSFGEYLAPAAVDRRVASMGFYHVLDLTTKHRIRADQPNAYGPITLTIL
ncbi:hypothetical protein FRC01_002736 [Tulasnella sp. 417]|nr:hypothetical protein FRC01_002736 [Tulasnella sp. 417]